MPAKRYYSEEDFERGVTLAQLKRVGRERRQAYVTDWFGRNFEDPAQNTPYNSREGGYLYVMGGPYDALEEIEQEFDSVIAFDELEGIAAELTADGTVDWAPGPEHPDIRRAHHPEEPEDEPAPSALDLDDLISQLESGAATRFGSEDEQHERAQLIERITALENEIERLRPTHGGIGHNQPPTDHVDSEAAPSSSLSDELANELNAAAASAKVELAKPEPEALTVAKSVSWLRRSLEFLSKSAVDGAAKEVGKNALLIVAVPLGTSLAAKILEVISAAIHWLGTVITPFF